jgi:hypothetical protein
VRRMSSIADAGESADATSPETLFRIGSLL